ncbi:MAG: glycoside hydrolase family 2 TIM barrel-domain containing protein [Bacteroides sp.]|nr:glycoside hydrolase family 2 TIM barrel-domain containing protein [Bacteroides sp.]
MKQLFIILLSLIAICQSVGAVPRRVENFNCEWRYMRGDHQGAEQPAYDDSQWEVVGLPHSFSMPYFMAKDFYTGYGWYRKSFNVEQREQEGCVFLEFDGVFQEAEVYVNGQSAGCHVGGYTGFYVDISRYIQHGSNTVAVRVNNLWQPDVAPRAGEHVFSGGIYRNVRLVFKSPVHIDWYGTFVTTPDLDKSQGQTATIRIETDVCNRSAQDGNYRLRTEIIDPDGNIVATTENRQIIAAHSTEKLVQTTKKLRKPQLWSPTSPILYKAISKLYKGKKLIDQEETTFGFRWMEWTADRGFFLNGEHLYFHGVNVHQDQAGWGDAVTEAGMHRDVSMMKEAGFDLIRGSHYPHAPAFVQACDELGMLFWSEAPFWGIGGFKPDGYWNASAYPVHPADEAGFEESALQQLQEMIRIHRNHPSIIAWSMCNEAFFSAAKSMSGVRRLLQRMVDVSHQLDPTRPAAIGGAQRPLGNDRIDCIGDIAGYNGDGATQPDFQHPDIPNLVSEYGSTTAERPGEYAPGWGDLAKDDGWKGRSWRSGQAIWCGFDHGSIAGSALGKMGIVDYFRIPKRSWYWYRNEYRQIAPPTWPVEGRPAQLKLEASKTTNIRTDGTDDVQLTVNVLDAEGRQLSNSPSVQLTRLSGPGEFPTGRSILFEKDSDIRILDGQAAISFRAYYAGQTIIEATSPGLPPVRLTLSFVGTEAFQPGISHETTERPYQRYVNQTDGEELLTFGPNNPTFAGSQLNGHGAGMAADSNPHTYWQAAQEDTAPYWMLDTEKGLTLHSVHIRFPQAAAYCYKVEASNNQKDWETILNKEDGGETVDEKIIPLTNKDNKVTARFVRISFRTGAKLPAATLNEVIVKGTVNE